MAFNIKVNGNTHNIDVDGDTPLLWVLRDVLGMTGTKFGCGMALCGACTVHVDGVATRSCITPIDTIGTSEITTIEAIGATPTGAKAWLDREVVQCGYCQSGQIMSAAAFLASNPHPTDADIDNAMSATSAAAARSSAFAKQSSRPRSRADREADNDPRPHGFASRRSRAIWISKRTLPAPLSAGRSGRGRRLDAEHEPVAHDRASRSG
jgi:isoquinoline 1-oxidoreductase subunit alpha